MPADFEDRAREERRYPNGERMPPDDFSVPGDPPPPEEEPYTPGGGRFAPALVLVAVGAIFLLINLGVLQFAHIWRYWPLILIVLGALRLSSHESGARSSAAVMLIVGAVFLLLNLGLFHLNFGVLWPLILIGVGLLLFSRTWNPGGFHRLTPSLRTGRRGRRGFGRPFDLDAFTQPASFGDADNRLENWVLFGGVERIITTQNFLGGDLTAIFGGMEIDLRRAGIVSTGKPVLIEANAIFGGISIKVPDHWRIAVRGVGVFGGYQDEAIKIRQLDPSAPLLVVSGYAAFGGVIIE